ncbi:cytochrome c oxidase assembly protein COX16 homolog, mitochondrial-like [Oscarella lobularis]|uniref:cytochrome c oxidase assembly protein COX16 homolog, mitochondrial-like n=1 Tax=Oscarella lobularis TaxID=121494 RepID=UPI0033139344
MTRLGAFGNRRFWKFGVPFVTFVVIGSFGLAEFTSIRVKRKDERTRMLTSDEMLKMQQTGKKLTLEDTYEEIKQSTDIEQWENIRGPRPWEETRTR